MYGRGSASCSRRFSTARGPGSWWLTLHCDMRWRVVRSSCDGQARGWTDDRPGTGSNRLHRLSNSHNVREAAASTQLRRRELPRGESRVTGVLERQTCVNCPSSIYSVNVAWRCFGNSYPYPTPTYGHRASLVRFAASTIHRYFVDYRSDARWHGIMISAILSVNL